jgi:hypothetical protein
MPILDDVVADLRAHPGAHTVYLTSAELGVVGSTGKAQAGDFQNDRDAHVVFWDPEEDVLAVDSHEHRNGKIASLPDFLARRSHLWFTAVTIVEAPDTELITRSSSVGDVLRVHDEQVARRKRLVTRAWCAAALLVLVLGALYYYKFLHKSAQPPARLPSSQSQSQPPLYLERRRR